MTAVVPEAVTALAGATNDIDDAVLDEMEAYADETGFPTVGPGIGSWLSVLVRATGAQRVFEFGSGFGYSAYWFARALGPDGEVILTEIDEEELEQARAFFEAGGYADRARFEHGDALEIVREYDDPFDVVLIDNEKERYVEAFEAVRPRLQSGSLVLADNAITASHIDREDVLAILQGKDITGATAASEGIGAYLRHVRDSDDVETALLPLGEGMAASVVQ